MYRRRQHKWLLVRVILFLWLFCSAEFFYIESIAVAANPISTYHNKLLVAILTLIMFIPFLLHIYPHRKRYTILEVEVWALIIISMVILLVQVVTEGLPITEGFSKCYYFFILASYFPLVGLCENYPSLFRWITNTILIIGTLYALVSWVCFGGYLLAEKAISTIPLHQYVNGMVRLPRSSDFVELTSILYMVYIARDGQKKSLWIGAIICFTELIVVAQVRMATLVVCVAFMILCWEKSKNKSVKTLICLFVGTLFLLDISKGTSSFIVTKFLGTGQRIDSVLYRLTEISYYIQHMFDGIFYGFGFTSDPSVLKYSITDIGIIGFVSQFGIIGVIWLLFFFGTIIRKMFICHDLKSKVFSVYILGNCISLSPFNSQRIVFLPFALLIIDLADSKMFGEQQ